MSGLQTLDPLYPLRMHFVERRLSILETRHLGLFADVSNPWNNPLQDKLSKEQCQRITQKYSCSKWLTHNFFQKQDFQKISSGGCSPCRDELIDTKFCTFWWKNKFSNRPVPMVPVQSDPVVGERFNRHIRSQHTRKPPGTIKRSQTEVKQYFTYFGKKFYNKNLCCKTFYLSVKFFSPGYFWMKLVYHETSSWIYQ